MKVKTLLKALSLFALFCGKGLLWGAPSGSVSENGRFHVDLSQPEIGKILVAVSANSNDVKTLKWSRVIDWKEVNQGIQTSGKRARVTDNGKLVVILSQDLYAAKQCQVRMISETGAEHRFDLMSIPDLRAPLPERPLERRRQGQMQYHYNGLFDLLLEDESRYAVWFAQTDEWLAISLEDFKDSIVRDLKQIERLNVRARAKALDPMPFRNSLSFFT